MASICTSNVTSGFIDLATFDELEKYMYGGDDATTYFVRETRKSTWFTMVPVCLSRASGQPAFDTEWSVTISRAGDYLLHTWLRLSTPLVELTTAAINANIRIRWTRNFMHNLVRECCITFNDLVAARFDNYHLDFWTAFTVPAGKRNGYNNMIGNIDLLTQPQTSLPATTLNLPLPLFFTRDTGVALPTAALPYNDMRINFAFRNWTDLLIQTVIGAAGTTSTVVNVANLTATNYALSNVQVWANYAIVNNGERQRMGCAPRDILMEQVQTAPRQTFNPTTNQTPSYDIRFSHAIKALFFAVRNTTLRSEWSNYTTNQPLLGANNLIDFDGADMLDPILQTSLIYENTNRLAQMGSDYFTLVNPWYHAPVIPLETGYHMYSYSIDFVCLDPMGSTNYGKLTNVSIIPECSTAAFNAAGQGNTYEFICTAVNNNIIRISGGKHPIVPPTADCHKSYDFTFMDKQCKWSSFNRVECI